MLKFTIYFLNLGSNGLESATATSTSPVMETTKPLPMPMPMELLSQDTSSPYGWPNQFFPVLKKAEIEREPTEVEVPSDTPAQQLPFKFVNK